MNQIPIYIVSLKQDKERRSVLERSLKRNDLQYDVFNAVDGRHLTDSQSHLVSDEALNREMGMRPGEIGCAMSHALLYQKIKNSENEEAIILEDDAIISKNFVKLAKDPQKFRDLDADILILFNHPKSYKLKGSAEASELGRLQFKFWGRVMGNVGYCISHRGAQILAESALPVRKHADWPIDIATEMKVVGVEPGMITHREAEMSRIQENGSRGVSTVKRIGRLLVLPSLCFPSYFGGWYKSKYIWMALYTKLRARRMAERIDNSDEEVGL